MKPLHYLMVCIGLASLTLRPARAQHPGDSLPPPHHKLALELQSISFFKNNEFSSGLSKGYTLTGYYFDPTLRLRLFDATQVRLGAHLLKYSGQEAFQQVRPLFAVRHALSPSVQIILGQLHTRQQHHLNEPLYFNERQYVAAIEEGVQFLIHTPRLQSDSWLNWEQYILPGSPFQEHFTVGNSHIFSLTPGIARHHWQVRAHALAYHKGGEIDTSPAPVQTLVNTGFGLHYSYRPALSGLQQMEWAIQGFTFHDLSPKHILAYQQGFGSLASMNASGTHWQWRVGYFLGENFLAPQGNPLLLSVSQYSEKYNQARRSVIINRVQLEKTYRGYLHAGAGMASYYHLRAAAHDFSFWIFLQIDTHFLLWQD